MRQTEIISFSLPTFWARRLKGVVKREGISLSEFLRNAIQQRIRARQWRRLREYGARTAKLFHVSPEDIESIVDEFRE